MDKPITFAIAGFGERGKTYASMQEHFPDKMKVVAVADIREEKVKKAAKFYDIPSENCFSSAEEMLANKKLADVVVVSTMDRQHVDHGILALKKGYNILLEKPISPELDKCNEILEVSRECEGKVVVCHVLRYTAFYNTIKDIIDSGKIGDVVAIDALENVGYWHQAHSFVRGNWRNSKETSPMILQKSCHDLDILLWLTGKKCKTISSVGSTYLFNKEHAPEGATSHCLGGCKAKENCIFDAEKIYLKNEKTGLERGQSWISSVISEENTIESTYDALKEGQYGRCVYMCDNDVVDHQQTHMLMTDGTTISFTMCAFSEDCYREFKAMGTKGEIIGDMKSNTITVREFGKGEETIDLDLIESDLKGHGGGDSGIIADFLEMLLTDSEPNSRTTTLEASMPSHYAALAAEESRLKNGKMIELV